MQPCAALATASLKCGGCLRRAQMLTSARATFDQTPLHLACVDGHTERAAALILAGARRAPLTRHGDTPADLTDKPEILALFAPAVKATN